MVNSLTADRQANILRIFLNVARAEKCAPCKARKFGRRVGRDMQVKFI
jgi:hypothetical protein